LVRGECAGKRQEHQDLGEVESDSGSLSSGVEERRKGEKERKKERKVLKCGCSDVA
jgi:hypothetical protein